MLNEESELCEEFENSNAADFLCASDEAKECLKQGLLQDDCLALLKETVLNGWPLSKEQVPIQIREHWNYRDEISVQEGVLFRSEQVIVPRSMHSDMIMQVHSGHLGIDACIQRTRDVLNGWPLSKEQVPIQIREHWNYRDEISVQDGVLFCSEQVIVPRSMRSDMIMQVHSGHLGIDACIQRTRDVLFWPGMQVEVRVVVRQAVQNCSACQKCKPNHTCQPMTSHPVPDRPWSIVSVDMFSLYGFSYLIMVDHYCDFWEIDRLDDTTYFGVITKNDVSL